MKGKITGNAGLILIGIAGMALMAIYGSVAVAHFHKDNTASENKAVSINSAEAEISDNSIVPGSTPWVTDDISMLSEIGDYKNISITVTAPETLSANDIKRYVDDILTGFPEYEKSSDKNRVIKNGDCVTLRISGKALDNNVPDIKENEMIITVSNNDVNELIDRQLPGKRAGDTIEAEYTYPDDFDDDAYRGKRVKLSAFIESINDPKFRVLETIDDDFAIEYLNSLSVDDFITRIKYEMYAIALEDRNTQIEEGISKEMEEICKFNIPEELLEQKFDQQRQFFINQVCDGDASLYEEKLKNYTGKTPDDYKNDLMDSIRKNTEQEIIASYIDLKEGLYDENAFRKYAASQVENLDAVNDVDDLFKYYDSSYETGEEYLKKRFLIVTAMNFLKNNAGIETSENASVVDLIQNAGNIS